MLQIHRTTTAEFRSLAAAAEAKGFWDAAAELWDAALDVHPGDYRTSELDREDMNQICKRRNECARRAADEREAAGGAR